MVKKDSTYPLHALQSHPYKNVIILTKQTIIIFPGIACATRQIFAKNISVNPSLKFNIYFWWVFPHRSHKNN